LLIGDLLYLVNDDGVVYAIDAQSGVEVWKSRIDGNYSASPIYADGRIYFCNRDSVTTVIEPGRQCKVLAVNRLNSEQMMASPAVAGRSLFLRTRTHLYCVEAP
jgi:hypothetical protein